VCNVAPSVRSTCTTFEIDNFVVDVLTTGAGWPDVAGVRSSHPDASNTAPIKNASTRNTEILVLEN